MLAASVCAGPAAADEPPAQCVNGSAIECLRVPVPLDRAGAIQGSVSLYAERVGDAARRPDAVVFISGGPGQSAIRDFPRVAADLAKLLDSRDLISFDQRGTGQSGRLGCPSLDRGLDARAVRACAERLGAAATFYRTADSVEDLDAVLSAFGVTRATLYGVSYGTRVALQYVAAHPERVSGLVLDSPVPPEGRDAFERSTLAAAASALRSVCSGGFCRGVTPDPVGDLTQLVRQMRGRPLTGPWVDRRGRVLHRSVAAADILGLLVGADFSPASRASLIAPIRAAAHGDPVPLVRVITDAKAALAAQESVSADSTAVNIATLCSETSMPWPATATLLQRKAAAAQALSALGSRALAPFDAATVMDSSIVSACEGWPATISAPSLVQLPDVPALILSGDEDVRTPTVDARAIAARMPRARVLTVGHVGHSVAGTDQSGCAQRAVRAFIAGRAVLGTCPGLKAPARRPVLAPSRFQDVAGTSPLARLARAVALTVTDGFARGITLRPDVSGPAGVTGPASGGALRGGWIRRRNAKLEFHGDQYISGVRVDGTVTINKKYSRLEVNGPGALDGAVEVRRKDGVLIVRTRAGSASATISGGLRYFPG